MCFRFDTGIAARTTTQTGQAIVTVDWLMTATNWTRSHDSWKSKVELQYGLWRMVEDGRKRWWTRGVVAASSLGGTETVTK